MKLIRTAMTEYYTAENGDHVSITINPDDKATLIICVPENNKMYFNQVYKTRRSALIAMHRKRGKCHFTSMTQTYRKS